MRQGVRDAHNRPRDLQNASVHGSPIWREMCLSRGKHLEGSTIPQVQMRQGMATIY